MREITSESVRKPRWPLVTIDTDDPDEASMCLSDAELITIKVALLMALEDRPDEFSSTKERRFFENAESAKAKIEQAFAQSMEEPEDPEDPEEPEENDG